MADKQRTSKKRDADEDAEAEERDEEREEREERDEDVEAEEKPEGAEEARSDEAAQRVAEALGLEGGEAEKAEAKEPEVVNRAARRREEALERRKKRRGGAKAEAAKPAEDDEDLPKDRNARAKALLQKRRDQASETRPVALLPGEMVDDALARSASAFSKWFKKNFSIIQWVFLAAVAGGGGYLVYAHYSEKAATGASDALEDGTAAERGRVMAEDKRSDDEKEYDSTKIFKTDAERADNALASYKDVVAKHPGTGAAMIAELGEAGVLLDKRDYQGAFETYQRVLSSPLAANDQDVKGRALEGLALAKEGKGDADGALSTFKELESLEAKGFKELAEYHQARLLIKKGEKEKAIDLLKKAHEALATPSVDGKGGLTYITSVVDDTLRELDPSAVPTKAPIGGPKGSTITPEQLEMIQRKLQEAGQKAPQGHP